MRRTCMKLLSVWKTTKPSFKTQPVKKPKEKKGKENSLVLQNVERFLLAHYDFRYNVLRDVTEYCPKDSEEYNFVTVDQREMNGLCLDARKAGIDCWDRDISRFVHSNRIKPYHPFSTYMQQLPVWDGTDRLEELAKRVSENPVWVRGFHRWMLGLAAQWMEIDTLHANSVAPVLVSRKQGKHKSTFCKLLLPEELKSYYTDSYDLNAQSSSEQKLTTFGLINLDEFDKFSERKMTLLKNIMQMASINIRKAYKKSFSELPRVASFIATSNRIDLLTDPSGSRRFLCIEVEKKIDVATINHRQIYAQLKAELEKGEQYWFNSEQEKEVMENNKQFQRKNIAEDIFHSYFRIPQQGEKSELFSAAHIYEQLRKKHPSIMREVSAKHFGKDLLLLGAERIHTMSGNRYRLVSIS